MVILYLINLLYTVIAGVQLNEKMLLIQNGLFFLISAFFYMGDFLDQKFNPKFLELVNFPPVIKTQIASAFNQNQRMILIFSLIFFPVLALGISFSIDLLSFFTDPVLFILGIPVGILLAIHMFRFYMLIFQSIYLVFKHRKMLVFNVSHEDGMGGSREVLALFFKQIYPIYFVIIIGGVGVIFVRVLFAEFWYPPFWGVIVLCAIIAFSGVFYFQVLLSIQMRKFKKQRVAKIRAELKDVSKKLKEPENLTPEAKLNTLIKSANLHAEKDAILEMKSFLINNELIKRLLIAIGGAVLSFVVSNLAEPFLVSIFR